MSFVPCTIMSTTFVVVIGEGDRRLIGRWFTISKRTCSTGWAWSRLPHVACIYNLCIKGGINLLAEQCTKAFADSLKDGSTCSGNVENPLCKRFGGK